MNSEALQALAKGRCARFGKMTSSTVESRFYRVTKAIPVDFEILCGDFDLPSELITYYTTHRKILILVAAGGFYD